MLLTPSSLDTKSPDSEKHEVSSSLGTMDSKLTFYRGPLGAFVSIYELTVPRMLGVTGDAGCTGGSRGAPSVCG